ncbi:MAG: SBBP repeat-containing protein, partial [Anaerolineae bacterium]|nr:SBBP repeat-containing protein [Anaerolineae bacterium]
MTPATIPIFELDHAPGPQEPEQITTNGSYQPLPHDCIGITPPGEPLPACCIYGYIYYHDAPTAGVNVQIESAHGILNRTTLVGGLSGRPFFSANLSAAPLSVSSGDTITLTASWSNMISRRTWIVQPEGQQVDLGLVAGYQALDSSPTDLRAADAAVLAYSTFFGGGGSDNARHLAVDGEGNIYIVGDTDSTNLPTTPGAYDGSHNGNTDVFVAKLSANGSALLYSTYLGGSGEDYGAAIALDGEGNIYITGDTRSANFPVTPGAYDTTYNGGQDVFVAKLNAASGALIYSTYLGGNSDQSSYDIAVDDAGSVYVGGATYGGFPVTSGAAQTTFGGYIDLFATKLSPDGSSLVYSTYLGGWSYDGNPGIAVDDEGNAYLAAHTHSTDFPTTPGAYDTVCDNCYTNVSTDATVTKLSADGSEFIYSTFVGGADDDCGESFHEIAVDPAGNAYLAGETCSDDYPTTPGALQQVFHGGEYDAVVTKLNADGSDLLYSTYLGGAANDRSLGTAIDAAGRAYVAGYTDSTDFPTAFPLQPANGGGRDIFIVQLDQDASTLLYGTYLGGSGNETQGSWTWMGFAQAMGGLYLAAATSSADLPTTPGVYDRSFNGGAYDAFVTKIVTIQPPEVWARMQAGRNGVPIKARRKES